MANNGMVRNEKYFLIAMLPPRETPPGAKRNVWILDIEWIEYGGFSGLGIMGGNRRWDGGRQHCNWCWKSLGQ